MAQGNKRPTAKQIKYIASLRKQLGEPAPPPFTSRISASGEISRLRMKQDRLQSRGPVGPGKALGQHRYGSRPPKPTDTQLQTIARLAGLLGIEPPQPKTEADARFVVDDLTYRERKNKRTNAP